MHTESNQKLDLGRGWTKPAFAHSCHNNQSYLNWHYQIAIFSGWFVQSVYKVVTCLSVVRIEQTLVAVVDQCTCASGIVTVDS